jgi:hypothetical protein
MYFEVQKDFYPSIRLENWYRIGAEKKISIPAPKMKEL